MLTCAAMGYILVGWSVATVAGTTRCRSWSSTSISRRPWRWSACAGSSPGPRCRPDGHAHADHAGAAAAQAAALRERDAQLGRLDDDTRDMLERIAAGEEFTAADVHRCRLIQARLRDGIRAPSLDAPELSRHRSGRRRDRGTGDPSTTGPVGTGHVGRAERVHEAAIEVIAG